MTDKQKRIYSFWAGILIAFVLPLLILSFKYHLFSRYVEAGRKWSFWVIVGVLFLLIKLWSALKEFISDMSFGWLRSIILGVMDVAPWLLLLGSTFLVSYFADDYIFIMRTITICQAIAIPLWVVNAKYKIDMKVARGDVRVIKQ